jgi:hypothetical protein
MVVGGYWEWGKAHEYHYNNIKPWKKGNIIIKFSLIYVSVY